MRRFHGWVCLSLALGCAGCMDSCGCAEGGGDPTAAGDESPAEGAKVPRGSQGSGEAAAEGTGAEGAGGTGAVDAGPPAPRAEYAPAPETELTRQLAAIKQRLEADDGGATGGEGAELATDEALQAALVDALGDYRASEQPPSVRRLGEGDGQLISAVRTYARGEAQVRVKVTDTLQARAARRAVTDRLLLIGNAPAGGQRGVLVRGYPALVAHFPGKRVSRASALVAGRYLVQVMVRNTDDPEAALGILGALDWGDLAPAEGEVPDVQQ
ncbi:MAG: hypothetical protein PVI30_09255 [Myxococcales bacterium]|jgi:hypothetical protein